MSAPTEAHREVAVAIFAIAMKSAHHGAPFREPCAQLVADSEARATAELRDSLALEQDMGNAACDELRGDADELRADVVRLTARAERAEAELAELHAILNQSAADMTAGTITAGALAVLREELAAERARLDAGTILLTVAGERVWVCGVDLRAAIDAAMKEGAK
jgi:hypothetical protein